jgi:hypothetical protein
MGSGGPAGFGQGGLPNALPGRGYIEYGTNDSFRDMPNDWVGGARGPAALPSRTIVENGPAPSEPLRGASGVISMHRGDFVEDAGAPRLSFDNVLGHGDIPWSRPTYPNVAGLRGYRPPTQMPSWTADAAVVPGQPTVGIPVSRKHIGSFTVREEFGSTRELFNGSSLAQFVASIQVGMDQQGRRWLKQAKTKNPWQPNLGNWGAAGSYGQTTKQLPTMPANVPTSYDTYGAY